MFSIQVVRLRSHQKEPRFVRGQRTVFDTARDGEQVAWTELDVAVTQLNGQMSVQDKVGLVLVIVTVPVRRSNALGHLEQVAIGLDQHLL